MTSALLSTGTVRHSRLRPVRHDFSYGAFSLLLPMRALAAATAWPIAHNRPGLLAFHDRDHGDGRSDALSWIESLLRDEGVDDVDGEIWLQTFPRVLGYAFKPVSFWYCHAADGRLRAIVAEVNNTFGERHCYLLDGPSLAWGRTLHARKVFHVSPFCPTSGEYRFRFMRTPQQIVARVELWDDDAQGGAAPVVLTSLSGRLQPLTRAAARAAWRAAPLFTLGVIARIHRQALALWLKRVPWWSRPAAPPQAVTR